MNSFIENVNYLASLDNNYGDGVVLSKNNLSLRNVANDITLKFSYFNYDTRQIETVTKGIQGMLYTGLEAALQEFVAQIEATLGGNKFDALYTISSANTGFLIHSFSITINSLDEKLKCTEINFNAKITSTQVEIYNLYGDVINPLKLLPVLAMLEPEVVNAIPMVYENIDSIIHINSNIDLLNDIKNNIIPNINEILEADNNALIALQKALDASASALSALEFKNSANSSAEIAIANADESELNASSALSSSNIATTKAYEASVSASSALSSKNAAAISETNSANSESLASNSAELALEYKNSAFSSSTSAENSASAAINNANASLLNANNASSSATNASISESNSLNSANLAAEKANSILNLDVEMTELPHGSDPTTVFNPGSGVLSIGIPEIIDGTDGSSVTNITSSKVGKTTTVNQYIDGVLANTFTVNDGLDGVGIGDMLASTYDTNNNGIVDNSEKVNGLTVKTAVPANAVFTDTVYDDTAILSAIETKSDKATTLAGYGITDADTSAQVTTKINNAVAALVDSSSATLDTLNELAAALGDDPNFATTTSTAIGTKVTKNADITAGTATKVTYDAKGLVTSGTTLSAGDIPVLDAGKITTGTLPVARGGTGVTTVTGTGSVVLNTSPILVTPNIGIAIGTSFNGITGLGTNTPIINGVATAGISTLASKQDHIHPSDTTKQNVLVSGTNIKTVNGGSILGSGNLELLTSINPVITGSITEQVYNLTGTAINPANGTIQYKTVSANTTFTETLTSGQSVLLRLIGASNYTITFPTITWVGAAAPVLTANCAIVLWKEQSTLHGAFVGTLV